MKHFFCLTKYSSDFRNQYEKYITLANVMAYNKFKTRRKNLG